MDDYQLIRTLESVGMEVFETFYDRFADETLTNQQVAALLKEHRNYTEGSCRSRVGHARMIIRAGRGLMPCEGVPEEPDEPSPTTQVTVLVNSAISGS